MEQNSFHLIEQASEMSKITLSVIVYAPCPSKTIIKTNKKQMYSSAATFFGMTRYVATKWILFQMSIKTIPNIEDTLNTLLSNSFLNLAF